MNGEPVEATETGGFAECSRRWQRGDIVEVAYPQRIRVEFGHRLGRKIMHSDEHAVFLGPRQFAMSDHLNASTDLHWIRVSTHDASAADFRPSGGDRVECEGVLPSGRSSAITLNAEYQASFDAAQLHFVECLRDGRDPETSGEDNLRTFRVAAAAYKSAAQSRVVAPVDHATVTLHARSVPSARARGIAC